MRKTITILTIFLIITSAGMSQDTLPAPDTLSRPKLGLALSGGGAKGLAHIGVIKVMEEAGLKPDYITGVSMGSIVGGFYAMGYSADSIANMFRAFNIEAAISDRIPENKIIFFEKSHYYNSIISLPITRKTIKLPSGLINGQLIESGLNYYFWPAAGISDFAELPVPFLCLAADIMSTRKVIFTHGYLPDAIRSSIAIPSVFTPVKTDTAVLIDGGVLRNFAVTELREMGADIVIGSYVGYGGATEKDLESVQGILKQIGFMTSLADFEEQKSLTDIMVEPGLKGYSTMSFSDVDSIIEKGHLDALKYKDRFIRLADSLDAIGPRKEVTPLPDVRFYQFDTIRVAGNNLISDAQILGVLGISTGQQVDRDLLAERIDLLYGKAWFEKVKYRIIPRKGSLILEIDCIERPKAMIDASLHYDPALSFGVVLSLSVRDLLTTRSVINFDAFIGQYYRLRLSAMQFINRSQTFGAEAYFYADNTHLPLVQLKNETGSMLSQNIIAGLALNKLLGLNHMMKLTATYENQDLFPDYITSTGIEKLSYDYLRYAYSYQTNTLDYKHFPNRGIIYSLSASTSRLLRGTIRTDAGKDVYKPGDESSFSFERFFDARAWFRNYTSPSEKITLNFGGDVLLVTNADSITSNNNFYYLGGIEPVTDRSVPGFGFYSCEIPVKALAGIRFGADIEITPDLHLMLDGNLFGIREPYREDGFSMLGGYGIGLGYMTIAGPIRAGIMHGIYESELLYSPVKGYVSIGFAF